MPRGGAAVLIDYDFGHDYPPPLIDHFEDLLRGELCLRILPCLKLLKDLLLLFFLLKTAHVPLE